MHGKIIVAFGYTRKNIKQTASTDLSATNLHGGFTSDQNISVSIFQPLSPN